jgi:hypothetical protein
VGSCAREDDLAFAYGFRRGESARDSSGTTESDEDDPESGSSSETDREEIDLIALDRIRLPGAKVVGQEQAGKPKARAKANVKPKSKAASNPSKDTSSPTLPKDEAASASGSASASASSSSSSSGKAWHQVEPAAAASAAEHKFYWLTRSTRQASCAGCGKIVPHCVRSR